MCKLILYILYNDYFIYRAKKNTKGYCLSKNKEIVDIYKINQTGGIINNSSQNINLNEINTINNIVCIPLIYINIFRIGLYNKSCDLFFILL